MDRRRWNRVLRRWEQISAPPGSTSGIPRPSSAPRRRHGLDFAWATKGPQEHRKEMVKQSSVPNLGVHDRGFAMGDGHSRSKRAGQVQAAYDPRPGMRRSASATSLGSRHDRMREDYAGRMAAGRPNARYEASMFQTPSQHALRQGMGSFPKADALQLESRLTQRLREHSFNSFEPTRRPNRRKNQVPLGGHAEPIRPGRNPLYRTASTAWPEGLSEASLGGSFSNFGTPNRRPMHSTASSPYQPSTYSQFGGAPTEGESSLKIYSDLFEEVIERDRVFGPLLRKVKSAYDSMLHSQEASTFVPQMPDGGAQSSLRASRSSEPTLRAEVTSSEPWELHRENQALKDLIERLHMELEEAVKREQRWKTKAAKLKARFATPVSQAPEVYPSQVFQGWMPVDERGYCFPEWAHEGDLALERPQSAPNGRQPAFQANRREPGVSEAQEMLNQAGLMSLSSISPQHSQLHRSTMEAMDHGSARSDDSGILPQRPERRVMRPPSVPKLDLTKMQQLEEEEYSEGEHDEAGQQYEQYEQYAPEHYPHEDGLDDDLSEGGRPPSEYDG